jgi:hypothetical protein
MSEEVKVNVPSTDIHSLEKIVKGVRDVTGQENTEISFEFILASLFPTCWKNIQAELNRQYTLGYIQGSKDKEEELKQIPSISTSDDADCYCE